MKPNQTHKKLQISKKTIAALTVSEKKIIIGGAGQTPTKGPITDFPVPTNGPITTSGMTLCPGTLL